jgi:hypothetical protein
MPRTLVAGALALLLSASWGLGAQPAEAAPHRPLAEVAILPSARLAEGGAAIVVKVRILCQPNGVDGIQWEGFANVTQGDVFGWQELSLDCDGRQHVEHVVVPVSGPPGAPAFSQDEATVSVFLVDENTLTQHATDTRTVDVSPAGR